MSLQLANDPTNVMGRRVVAYLIDAVIGLLIAGALFISQAEVVEGIGGFDDSVGICDLIMETESSVSCIELGDDVLLVEGGDSIMVWLAGLGFGFLTFVVLTALTGASVGKLVMGLRVVDAQGQRCSFGKAAARWALLVIDSVCFVGFFVAAFTHPHRRVGDMAAGTYVVAKSSLGRPVGTPMVEPPAAYAAQPGGWQPPPGPPN